MDIRQQNYPPEAAPPTSSNNGFPIIAIAIIGIIATILILVSYYIFVSSCCFRLKHFLNPSSSSLQRFSFSGTQHNQDLLFMHSRRGLDDRMIHEIPTFQYCKTKEEGEEEEGSNSLFKCVVCLNEFQDHDLLRLLPNCNHAFHIDCIDVWLQNNVNCPLCRASLIVIGGRDPNIAPNSSPQDQQPIIISRVGSDEHFIMIHVTRDDTDSFRIGASDSNRHLGGQSSRKSGKLTSKKIRHVSVMGDECINVREKDELFSVKPIRRSFSMDSAADHHVYLSVQGILRHNRRLSEIRSNGESSRRSQRSIFSFGCSRGSENAVLPLDQS